MMNNECQLTLGEKELIEGIKRANKATEEEFVRRFQQQIEKIAEKYLNERKEGIETKKDLTQDIFIKLLEKIRTHDIKESLSNWTFRLARNYCIDRYRKRKRQAEVFNAVSLIDRKDQGQKVMVSGSRKYYRKKTKKNVSPELQKSLEISLDYVQLLYRLKNEIGQEFRKYEPVLKIDEALKETKRKFNYVLPRVSDEKISSYKPIVFKKRPQPGNFLKHGFIEQEYRTWAHIKLNRLIYELVDEVKFFAVTGYEVTHLIASPFFEPASEPPTCCGVPLLEFGIKLSKMEISPPRLIYSIWSKAKELKRGKQVDNREIESRFEEFKENNQGTEKEFLFDSDMKLESLRQLAYRNKEFHKKIINFIYRKSFIEKEKPVVRTIS